MFCEAYIGHKRPPVKNRFKKGQSGNPSGRPKGSKNAKSVFLAIANRKVRIREKGKVKYLTQLEVILQAMALKAMKGDARAADSFHKFGRTLGIFDPNPPEPGKYGVTEVLSMEQWEKRAREQQAPYAGNETDGLVKKDEPKNSP